MATGVASADGDLAAAATIEPLRPLPRPRAVGPAPQPGKRGNRMRRTLIGLLAAGLVLQAGIAAANTLPGAAGQSPSSTPSVDPFPSGPQLRPTTPSQPALLLPAIQAARESARQGTSSDEAVDQALGLLLPAGPAD
jgi:hypothetical protein